MKKFLPKFLILFAVILAVIGYYHFLINPKFVAQALGSLGKIDFGKDYIERYPYSSKLEDGSQVVDCKAISEISEYRIVTIGDSFSQQKGCGYQKFIAEKCNVCVGNFPRKYPTIDPVADFMALLNNDAFMKGK